MSNPFELRATPERQGDPGKLDYIHNPNWTGKPTSMLDSSRMDSRCCPGCISSRDAHVQDERCLLWKGAA